MSFKTARPRFSLGRYKPPGAAARGSERGSRPPRAPRRRDPEKPARLFRGLQDHFRGLDRHRYEGLDQLAFGRFVDANLAVEAAGDHLVGRRIEGQSKERPLMTF